MGRQIFASGEREKGLHLAQREVWALVYVSAEKFMRPAVWGCAVARTRHHRWEVWQASTSAAVTSRAAPRLHRPAPHHASLDGEAASTAGAHRGACAVANADCPSAAAGALGQLFTAAAGLQHD